jgi:hypothetical protein
VKKKKEEEMGSACGTCRDAKFIESFDRETWRDCIEDLGIDGEIILICLIKNGIEVVD